MPNRMIREGWLESVLINRLDANAERFFLRLCLRADDFGRFHANPTLLRSSLFPLRDDVRSADIPRWLAACEKAGLVRCYKVAGTDYVELAKFNQRMRAAVSKFPAPPTDDGHVSVIRQTHDGPPRSEAEPEAKSETLAKRSAAAEPTSEEEWLKDLSTKPAYESIDVKLEFSKMRTWCENNRKQPTRRRFVNWLNRCDLPLLQKGGPPQRIKEPKRYTAEEAQEG